MKPCALAKALAMSVMARSMTDYAPDTGVCIDDAIAAWKEGVLVTVIDV